MLSLCNQGEIFEYMTAGRFPIPEARYIARQLILALDECHAKGISHRDIKPENLLLDDQFNLILTDFGFAHKAVNPNDPVHLVQILGTTRYMAPEFHLKVPYLGTQVDIFAAGVVLFILFTGRPPFSEATPQDSFYSNFFSGDVAKFWRNIKNKYQDLEADFADLVTQMLAKNPDERPTTAQVLQHSWFSGETATEAHMLQMFPIRKQEAERIRIENEKKEQEKAKRKAEEAAQAGIPKNPAFGGFGTKFRDLIIKQEGLDDLIVQTSLQSIEQIETLKLVKEVAPYRDFGGKIFTNIFLSLKPEDALKLLIVVAHSKSKKVEVNLSHLQVEARFPGQFDYSDVHMQIYRDGENSVIEFMKLQGDYFEYQSVIADIKERVQKLYHDLNN